MKGAALETAIAAEWSALRAAVAAERAAESEAEQVEQAALAALRLPRAHSYAVEPSPCDYPLPFRH